jgi:Trk K+ transport system NAD-binding subunit
LVLGWLISRLIARIDDYLIEPETFCDGMQVNDGSWPDHFVIASLRRGTQVLIPRGNAVLCEGDVLTVVGEAAALNGARRLCMKAL